MRGTGPPPAPALNARPRLARSATVDVATIDDINILQATMSAMELAVSGLGAADGDTAILVDGNRLPAGFDPGRSRALVKGDSKSFCIAAASIVAKVTRDRIMLDLHQLYPCYGFAKHKGYGVQAHVEAIRRHGPCPEHRRTFAPVKTWYPLEVDEAKEEAKKKEAKETAKENKKIQTKAKR